MAAIQAFDSFDRLPQINAPTLILHGECDLLVPVANAHVLKDRIPAAELRVLPGAGHVFTWEFPEVSAAAVVEFLTKAPIGV